MIFLLIFSFLLSPAITNPSADSAKTIAYVNGNIWNGSSFIDKTLFVKDGHFVAEMVKPDSTVDLNGNYVIPPFAEAHNHAFTEERSTYVFARENYIQNGVFYALNLTGPYTGAKRMKPQFINKKSLDVAHSYGGITFTGRHPAPAMERLYGEEDASVRWKLEGDAYWFMDTLSDVEQKWPDYIKQNPDVVKVYIIYSGGGEGRGECGYGLCPDVLKNVVKRAHEADKRVFAHVNTAEDVKLALKVGVDALAHLPLGNDGISYEESAPFTLDPETIAEIGNRNLVITPTASLLAEDLESFRKDTLQKEINLQRKQLKELYEAGAKIALGSDGWSTNPLQEARYLNAYEIFNNKTLLNIWTQDTPKVIFPDRKIGKLQPGYEASFLVLKNNPVENFEAIEKILLSVKQGQILQQVDK